MSVSIISLSRHTSTRDILRSELNRIESATGYRPEDWLTDVYDECIDDFRTGDGFDFDGFSMHLSFMADDFIDFINEHYKDLHMTI